MQHIQLGDNVNYQSHHVKHMRIQHAQVSDEIPCQSENVPLFQAIPTSSIHTGMVKQATETVQNEQH